MGRLCDNGDMRRAELITWLGLIDEDAEVTIRFLDTELPIDQVLLDDQKIVISGNVDEWLCGLAAQTEQRRPEDQPDQKRPQNEPGE